MWTFSLLYIHSEIHVIILCLDTPKYKTIPSSVYVPVIQVFVCSWKLVNSFSVIMREFTGNVAQFLKDF